MGLVGVIRKARFSNVRTPTGETGVQDRYSNTFTPEEGKVVYDWPEIDEDMTSTLTPEQKRMFAAADIKEAKRKRRLKAMASSLGAKG